MAELYLVMPLSADNIAELASFGVRPPAQLGMPRPLTPRQVLLAVRSVPGLEATVRRRPEKQLIRIDLSPPGTGNTRPAGSGTEISLVEVTTEDSPCQLEFRGGTATLVASVAERIAAECGPIVIWPASGAPPFVCTGEPTDAQSGTADNRRSGQSPNESGC
ncbi:hypothetical protein [Tuwongella immobilis]|uniref:Uncharacterized protein n=1 Tax=Tuwongella immobilis TaxID=692036 RepID=A0A6C2YGL3_9BACT|nr:hypothetical protein [Tuwongella immobilis]VIP00660.1 unnamed protein product [Tuwongella immobilis]VTR96738.1 unnamed protein product [Tuwongella immobilis]